MFQHKKYFTNILIWILIGILGFCLIEIVHVGTDGLFRTLSNKNVLFSYQNFNLLLIITSFSLLFKRSHFWALLIYSIIVLFSLISKTLFEIRGSYLVWGDFQLIAEGISIANLYINEQIIFSVLIYFLITIIFLMLAWKIKFEDYKVSVKFRIASWLFILMILLFNPIMISLNRTNLILQSINEKYESEGFIKTFTESYLVSKNAQEIGYSFEDIEKISAKYNLVSNNNYENQSNPNIILVQLESVIDPYVFKNLQFSEDPLKNFREETAKENVAFGDFIIPSPPNTSRTEFSVLTNVNSNYLPQGYMPYEFDFFGKKPIENIAFYLSQTNIIRTTVFSV